MSRDKRRALVSRDDVAAAKQHWEKLQADLEAQEARRVSDAARCAGVDLGKFSEEQIAEVLRKLEPTFPAALAESVAGGTRKTRIVGSKGEIAHAIGSTAKN